MRIDHAGLLAGACTVLAAAVLCSAASLLQRQAQDDAAAVPDATFSRAALPADDRPSPGWLHVGGVPGMLRHGPDTALEALTGRNPAATIRWWMPLP